ncbi:exosortase N [Mucilaginibacter pedocola]|uniref:Exosortase N n=1 Tax=Mucilaginibacter pedocola TaxID=1792845 RepID=A0A1S9PAJ6_9SPHI|nr:exosortase N [Mucilaginibacter pedocola]OOQ58006.1 exosortase N [Mucilaginibacter pedocola]
MLSIQLNKPLKLQPIHGFVAVYAALALWCIPGYFQWDANLVMGLLLIPYMAKIDSGRYSLRYLLPALLATGLALLAPVNTLFFIALVLVFLLLIENCLGRINHSVLFLLMLVSPVFRHFTRLAEFPVRLWLSDKVAATLSTAGIQAAAAGNQIQMDKYEFSVDPACAGLNMLVMSVLIGLFVLTYYQKQSGKTLNFKWLTLLLSATLLLNVVCNFFRILLLVLFKLMPGTFMHDAVGIACLCVYVLMPLLFGIKPPVARFGKITMEERKTAEHRSIRYLYLHVGLLTAMVFMATRLVKADRLVNTANHIQIQGYHKTPLEGGILKFEDSDALIYLKPAAFYAPEHDPMICWVGSGYTFQNIRRESINGLDVYTATLVKNTDRIYSAWWFDNGHLKTVNQFAWRWAAAKGDNQFYLVNVSAASPQKLKQNIAALSAQNLFDNHNMPFNFLPQGAQREEHRGAQSLYDGDLTKMLRPPYHSKLPKKFASLSANLRVTSANSAVK